MCSLESIAVNHNIQKVYSLYRPCAHGVTLSCDKPHLGIVNTAGLFIASYSGAVDNALLI